jgi:hypothetical protein
MDGRSYVIYGASFDGPAKETVRMSTVPDLSNEFAGRRAVVTGGTKGIGAARRRLPGDGYFPGGDLDPAGYSHRLNLIRDECAATDRDPATTEVTVYAGLTDPDPFSARIEELRAIGVSRILLDHLADDQLDTLVTVLTDRFGSPNPRMRMPAARRQRRPRAADSGRREIPAFDEEAGP